MRSGILLLGCILALSAPAAAQPGTPPAESSRTIAPSHLAVAREFLDVIRMQEAAAAGMEVSMNEQIEINPELKPYQGVIQKWAREIFASEEAKNAFATAYAETFSEAELRELIAFYRTPLGRRLAENQTALVLRGAEIGRRLADAHQAELMQRLQEAMAGNP